VRARGRGLCSRGGGGPRLRRNDVSR